MSKKLAVEKAEETVTPPAVPAAPKVFNFANAPIKEVMARLAEPGVFYNQPDSGSRAERIARLWAAEPRIRTLVQKEHNESKLVTQPFCVNGFKGEVKKGAYV